VESGTLKRNESQKNDYPLHHVHVRTDEEGQSNALKSPMLKADHGQLMFSSSTDTYRKDLDNPDYGIIREEQATLKIDRDLSTSLGDQQVGGVEHARDIINLSQQSLDRVSQLSPELDISDEEMSNLLADV